MFGANFTGRSRQTNLTLASDRVPDRDANLAKVRAQREAREREARMRSASRTIQSAYRGFSCRRAFISRVLVATNAAKDAAVSGDDLVALLRMWLVIALLPPRYRGAAAVSVSIVVSEQVQAQLPAAVGSLSPTLLPLLTRVLFSNGRCSDGALTAFTRLTEQGVEGCGLVESSGIAKSLVTAAFQLRAKGGPASVYCSLSLLSAAILVMGLEGGHAEIDVQAKRAQRETLALLALVADDVSEAVSLDPFREALRRLPSHIPLLDAEGTFYRALKVYSTEMSTTLNEQRRLQLACRLLDLSSNGSEPAQSRAMWEGVSAFLCGSPQQSIATAQYLLTRGRGESMGRAEEAAVSVNCAVLALVSSLSFSTDPPKQGTASFYGDGLAAAAATIRSCGEEIKAAERWFADRGSTPFSKAHLDTFVDSKATRSEDHNEDAARLRSVNDALCAVDSCCRCFIGPWLALTEKSSLQSNKRRRAIPLLSTIVEQRIPQPEGGPPASFIASLWSMLVSLADPAFLFAGGRFRWLLLHFADRGADAPKADCQSRFVAPLPNVSLLFLNLFAFYVQSTDLSADLVSRRVPLCPSPSDEVVGHLLTLLGSLKETALVSHLQGCDASTDDAANVAQASYRLLTSIHIIDESTNFVERVLLPWQRQHRPHEVPIVVSSSSVRGVGKNRVSWWSVAAARYTFPTILSFDDWTELTRLNGPADASEAQPGVGVAESAPAEEQAGVSGTSSDDEPTTLAAERSRMRLPTGAAAGRRAPRRLAVLASKMTNVAMEASSKWSGAQKVMMLLQHCPFLVPFANRVSIFSSLIYADRQRNGGGFRTQHLSSEVFVERGGAFVDAYNQLRALPVDGFRGSLPVRFFRHRDNDDRNPRLELLSTNSRYSVDHHQLPRFREQLADLDERLEAMEFDLESMDDSPMREQMQAVVRDLHATRADIADRISIPGGVSQRSVRLIAEEDVEQGYGDGVQRDFITELCQDGFGPVRGLFTEAMGVDVTSGSGTSSAHQEPQAQVAGVYPNSDLPNELQRDDPELQMLVQLRDQAVYMRDDRTVQDVSAKISRRIQRIYEILEDQHRFLGSMVGKALRDGVLLDVSFAHFFRNLILGRVNGAADVASYDAEMYRSFAQMRSMAEAELRGDGGATVEDLELRFTVSTQRTVLSGAGSTIETVEVPLLPGGENMPVTAVNLPMYLHLVADYRVNKSIRRFSDAFRRGLYGVIDPSWIRLFDARELHTLWCGGEEGMVGLDVADWQHNTQLSGDLFNPSRDALTVEQIQTARGGFPSSLAPTFRNLTQHNAIGPTAARTVGMFWDIVTHDFTPHQQRLLLKFATSLSRAPLLGFGFMNPPFNIVLLGGDIDRLPSAATCMCMLRLPQYPTREVMKDKLVKAIEGTNTFEMS